MSNFTKADVFRRAHALCRLNQGWVRERGYRAAFRQFLKDAWAEWRTGDTRFWTPPTPMEALKAQLIDLEARPLAQRVAEQIASVRRQIAELQQHAA